MRNLLCALILLLSFPSFVFAQTAKEATVRVYVYEDADDLHDVMGSGVLVANNQVITNYHVIKDCRQGDKPVMIRFADGWRSWATIEKVNVDWDLALLRINPHVTIKPVPIGVMPQPGDVLTVHGLGRDYEYKAQTGKMSPPLYGPKSSSEGYWLAVMGIAARNGDSGGPITNSKGQWVGTLFGSNDDQHGTYTLGSHIDIIKQVFGKQLTQDIDYNFKDQ